MARGASKETPREAGSRRRGWQRGDGAATNEMEGEWAAWGGGACIWRALRSAAGVPYQAGGDPSLIAGSCIPVSSQCQAPGSRARQGQNTSGVRGSPSAASPRHRAVGHPAVDQRRPPPAPAATAHQVPQLECAPQQPAACMRRTQEASGPCKSIGQAAIVALQPSPRAPSRSADLHTLRARL